MVLPDWTQSPAPLDSKKDGGTPAGFDLTLARPLDRLAAAIVDVFIVIGPLYVLVSAPIKRGFTASTILGSESDLLLSAFLMLFSGAAILIIYQTLSLYFFATTIGKRLFDLKVVPVFSESLGFWDYLLRSVVWVFELLLLGLPWLAVFSNSKRRPLHDRVSDSLVVSRTGFGVDAPLSWERGLVRVLFSALIGFCLTFVLMETKSAIEKIKDDESLAYLIGKDSGRCEVVSSHFDEREERQDESDPHDRLKMAMILYAAGLADRECLEAEVEYEVGRQTPVGPITYLAQAFIYADDAEVSNSYLDEVCLTAGDSVECSMSRLVSAWSDEDWASVENIVRTASTGSGYLEIWGVRHFMKQAKYGEALALLDTLLDRVEVKDFSLVHRVKALYSTYKPSEAQAAYEQAVVALPSEDARDLSSWLCMHELQGSCQALNQVACRQIPKLTDDSDEGVDFSETTQTMAHVLALECQNKVDYLRLGQSTRKPHWERFFRANLKRQREDRLAAADLFSQILDDENSPEVLRIESARRLAKFATPQQMEQMVKSWFDLEPREAWVKTGNILFKRLAEQNNLKLALKVGQNLMNAQALSPQALEQLSSLVDSSVGPRAPASVGSMSTKESH